MGSAIDLRSDTVTHPSPEMRAAIASAAVGDDVYFEDPTVTRLEALAAEMVGKEAAMLVPTGTMGNLCALLAHCTRGEEAIVGNESHIFHYEGAGAAVLGGVSLHPVQTLATGELPLQAISNAIRDQDDFHEASTKLICLENTHNRCGGTVLSPSYMQEVQALAKQNNLNTHLDGARMFNAAVALGVDVREITQHVDTVQFCLSKGLAAPVGSMIAGDAAFMKRARRWRKVLGGGMRQAGILAAAGILALTEMVDRLADDHANAQTLAKGLATIPGISIDLSSVQTNIVIFRVTDERWTPNSFIAALQEQGILMGELGYGRIRAVTHYGIEASDIERTLELVQTILA
jgi:threonine aldolase